jgi:hypothetical protein
LLKERDKSRHQPYCSQYRFLGLNVQLKEGQCILALGMCLGARALGTDCHELDHVHLPAIDNARMNVSRSEKRRSCEGDLNAQPDMTGLAVPGAAALPVKSAIHLE